MVTLTCAVCGEPFPPRHSNYRGQTCGRACLSALRRRRPLGSLIQHSGGVYVKIGFAGRFQERYRPLSVVVWEHAHGPIPHGWCLWFRDRNRRNCALTNLELITRAERCRRGAGSPASVAKRRTGSAAGLVKARAVKADLHRMYPDLYRDRAIAARKAEILARKAEEMEQRESDSRREGVYLVPGLARTGASYDTRSQVV